MFILEQFGPLLPTLCTDKHGSLSTNTYD